MSETYKIGEAATMLNLKTYVLRFWETEFPDVVPLRTEKGQRQYTPDHIALLERIRYLLHDRGLTIGGARKILAEEKSRGLRYVFGVPGALPRNMAEPGLYLEPEDEREPLPNVEVPVSAPADAPGKAGGRQTAQFNLPGLEELIALRERILDSPDKGEYASSENTRETRPDPLQDDWSAPPPRTAGRQAVDPPPRGETRPLETPPGLLPLFSAAMAAFAGNAGLFSPVNGGSNFIQPGGRAAPPRQTDAAEAERRIKLAESEAKAMLRVIARELEMIARALRGNDSSETS